MPSGYSLPAFVWCPPSFYHSLPPKGFLSFPPATARNSGRLNLSVWQTGGDFPAPLSAWSCAPGFPLPATYCCTFLCYWCPLGASPDCTLRAQRQQARQTLSSPQQSTCSLFWSHPPQPHLHCPKPFRMSWQLVQTRLKRPPKPASSLNSHSHVFWRIWAVEGHHVVSRHQGLHCA